MSPLLLVTTLLVLAPAHAAEAWLTVDGAGELAWGTTEMPLDSKPRDKSAFLPDAGFIGASVGEKPVDILLPVPDPARERRILRYVKGTLVDAWHVREGEVDAGAWAMVGVEEWRGPVLGPAEDGWRAYGDATSWRVGDKTVLHWRDRSSPREILVVRTIATRTHKSVRPTPLSDEAPNPTGAVKLKGELKALLRSVEKPLSGCLNQAEKPIEMTVELLFDPRGRPGRIKVATDKMAPNVVDCVAGVVSRVGGTPGQVGSVTAVRLR